MSTMTIWRRQGDRGYSGHAVLDRRHAGLSVTVSIVWVRGVMDYVPAKGLTFNSDPCVADLEWLWIDDIRVPSELRYLVN